MKKIKQQIQEERFREIEEYHKKMQQGNNTNNNQIHVDQDSYE